MYALNPDDGGRPAFRQGMLRSDNRMSQKSNTIMEITITIVAPTQIAVRRRRAFAWL
jgi:hypothetical protein